MKTRLPKGQFLFSMLQNFDMLYSVTCYNYSYEENLIWLPASIFCHVCFRTDSRYMH